jgi:hypothetical protein
MADSNTKMFGFFIVNIQLLDIYGENPSSSQTLILKFSTACAQHALPDEFNATNNQSNLASSLLVAFKSNHFSSGHSVGNLSHLGHSCPIDVLKFWRSSLVKSFLSGSRNKKQLFAQSIHHVIQIHNCYVNTHIITYYFSLVRNLSFPVSRQIK